MRATAVVAMLPPAPPRFSMITGLPSASPSGVLMTRAAMSVPPPAGKHTTMVICLSGYCACAASGTSKANAARTSLRRTMAFSRAFCLRRVWQPCIAPS